jgi:hypothetical protein
VPHQRAQQDLRAGGVARARCRNLAPDTADRVDAFPDLRRREMQSLSLASNFRKPATPDYFDSKYFVRGHFTGAPVRWKQRTGEHRQYDTGGQRVGQSQQTGMQYCEDIVRLPRSSWNFGGGPMMSGCVDLLIMHAGCDSLADVGFEGGA